MDRILEEEVQLIFSEPCVQLPSKSIRAWLIYMHNAHAHDDQFGGMDFGEELARMKAEMGGRSIGFANVTVGQSIDVVITFKNR